MKTEQRGSAPAHPRRRHPRLPGSRGGHPADGHSLPWRSASQTALACGAVTREGRPQGWGAGFGWREESPSSDFFHEAKRLLPFIPALGGGRCWPGLGHRSLGLSPSSSSLWSGGDLHPSPSGGIQPSSLSGPEPLVYIEWHPKISCSENHNTQGLSKKNLTHFSAINSG